VGGGGIAPQFFTLELDGGERSMLIYSGKGDRKLGEPRSRSGCCREEKISLSLPGIEPRPSSPYPVAISAQLSRPATKHNIWVLNCSCNMKFELFVTSVSSGGTVTRLVRNLPRSRP
jgi:hypothetical protein